LIQRDEIKDKNTDKKEGIDGNGYFEMIVEMVRTNLID
jgi:hypothetical protein